MKNLSQNLSLDLLWKENGKSSENPPAILGDHKPFHVPMQSIEPGTLWWEAILLAPEPVWVPAETPPFQPGDHKLPNVPALGIEPGTHW